MAASGRQRDAVFAAGVLGALREAPGLEFWPSLEHWRPIVRMGDALGTAEGDLGLLVRHTGDQGWTLLIVEREGSAPGNERSILKWREALRRGDPIWLRCGQRGEEVAKARPRRALLLLVFGSSERWRGTPYAGTVAFCRALAEMVNEAGPVGGVTLRVRVEDAGSDVEDWRACGGRFGREVASLLAGG